MSFSKMHSSLTAERAFPNDLTCQWNQDACEFYTFLHFRFLIDILASFTLNILNACLAACLVELKKKKKSLQLEEVLCGGRR